MYLLPLAQVPRAVGVGLVAVADLVTAQGIPGSRGNVERLGEVDAVQTEAKLAEEASYPEQNAALVVAGDEDEVALAEARGAEGVGLGEDGGDGRCRPSSLPKARVRDR